MILLISVSGGHFQIYFFFHIRKKIYFYLSLKELAQLQRIHVGNNDGNRFRIVTFLLIGNPQEVEKYPKVVGFYPFLASVFL